MQFDLVPDTHTIPAILSDAIEGPYRFIHDALQPYVGVGPATTDQLITIHTTRHLKLLLGHQTRRLHGLDSSVTFAVMLGGVDDTRLVEVSTMGAPIPRMRSLSGRKVRGTVPIAITVKTATARPPLRLVTAPSTPEDMDVSIPECFAEVCKAEDVHADLGDYLVVPMKLVLAKDSRRTWIVQSPHVSAIEVVKPRLEHKVDRHGE